MKNETGAITNGPLTHDYHVDGGHSVQLGQDLQPLVAEYGRDGVDLTLADGHGGSAVIHDYFASFPAPDLLTAGGARIPGDVVTKLAGSGPLAQDSGTQSDAGGPIGEVTELVGTVTAKHADGTTDELVQGSSVFQGDILQTGDGGAFTVVFADDTKFSMGENGRAVLDEMIYNPSTESGTFGMSLLQGVFSVVSGKIAHDNHDNVDIRTPVGTIGIRGTHWAGHVRAIGEESVFTLFSGAIVVINEGGSQELTQVNQSVVVTSFTSSPAAPFIMTNEQLFDNYGHSLQLIDPNYFKNEDNFDPDKINPQGGRHAFHNGGAGFEQYIQHGIDGGAAIGDLLKPANLLDSTNLNLSTSSEIEETVGVGPQTSLNVTAIIDPQSGNIDTFQVIVSLNEPVNKPVTVTYEILPGTATGVDNGLPGDVDFVFSEGGSIVIPAGGKSGSFTINVVDDDVIENTETFIVRLTGVDNADLNPAFSQAVIVIKDDDIGIVSVGQATVGGVPVTGGENVVVGEDAGQISYELILDKAVAPHVQVAVNYTLTGSATEGSDYISSPVHTAVFDGGATGLAAGSSVFITVPIVNDTVYEGPEDLTLTLVGGSSNSVIDTDNSGLTVTIEDNDTPILGTATDVVVQEDDLPGGSDTSPESTTATGDVPLDFGDGGNVTVTLDIGSLPVITSHGDPVFYQLETLSDGVTQRVTAIATPEEGASRTVFTLDFAPSDSGDNYSYSFTLDDALDHPAGGADSLDLSFGYDVAGEGAPVLSGDFTVSVGDDVPVANPDELTLPTPQLPAYDLVFVLDTSGSMGFTVPGGAGETRIDVLRDAVSNVLDEYADSSRAVNITFISFATASSVVFSGSSIDDAKAFLADDTNLVPAGDTNYAAAVGDTNDGAQGVLTGHLSDSSLTDFNQIAYFISDGAPSTGDEVPTDGGNAWQTFVDTNGIEVLAVGIGSNLDTAELAKVENLGDAPVVVVNPNDLSGVLIDSVPVIEMDNVISQGTAIDQFGADGGSLTSISSGGTEYDIPQNGDPLIVNTALGGNLTIDSSGNYTYIAPTTVESGTVESFQYVITDGDGDTSATALSFTFTENPAGEIIALSAFAPLPSIDGTEQGELLAGTGASEMLLGHGGDDILQGNGGNDVLTGGTGADSFNITGADHGTVNITDFNAAEDTVNLDQIFDALGIAATARGEGQAWQLSNVNGTATLTFTAADTPTVTFENYHNPDVHALDEIAAKIVVDES
ncbi:MAG: VWA domain-containing protein [Alphaproteobacteria bacterium]|nr:MAG: VWA domain-containing protein [Alphaproteobacteria bacterium]